jgi:hypothetical protein
MCGSSILRVTLPGMALVIGNLLEPEKSLDGQERRLTGLDQPDPAPLTLNTINKCQNCLLLQNFYRAHRKETVGLA